MYIYTRRTFVPMLVAGTLAVTAIEGLLAQTQTSPPERLAYHKDPPTGFLPPTLDPSQFADDKAAFVVYSIAAKIPTLIYQLPCYCHCDRHLDHTSLHDCFVQRHGVGCKSCQVMIVFAYEQSRLGKSAAEIRNEMEKHDFLKMDVDKHIDEHYAEFAGVKR